MERYMEDIVILAEKEDCSKYVDIEPPVFGLPPGYGPSPYEPKCTPSDLATTEILNMAPESEYEEDIPPWVIEFRSRAGRGGKIGPPCQHQHYEPEPPAADTMLYDISDTDAMLRNLAADESWKCKLNQKLQHVVFRPMYKILPPRMDIAPTYGNLLYNVEVQDEECYLGDNEHNADLRLFKLLEEEKRIQIVKQVLDDSVSANNKQYETTDFVDEYMYLLNMEDKSSPLQELHVKLPEVLLENH